MVQDSGFFIISYIYIIVKYCTFLQLIPEDNTVICHSYSNKSEAIMFSALYKRSAREISKSAAISISLTASFVYAVSRPVAHNAGENVTLPKVYQYQICPYCHRVKAYLDYLKVNYEVVEVNPLTKSELSFSKEYKKVPIAVFNDEVIGDSGAIISFISKNYPTAPGFITEDTDKWMEWSEKRLAVLLYPNITRSKEECWECFAYADNVFTWNILWRNAVRTIGPIAMSFANGRIKKKYGIVDERRELKDVLSEWVLALNGKKFLHGEKVTLPDLMVYGVLRSIRNFQTFREVMSENAELRRWYSDVDAATGTSESCAV